MRGLDPRIHQEKSLFKRWLPAQSRARRVGKGAQRRAHHRALKKEGGHASLLPTLRFPSVVIASVSEAIHLPARGRWIASEIAFLAMTEDTHSHSRGTNRPRLISKHPPLGQRARESRVPAAPVASCVKLKTHELVTTGEVGALRPSPRNGFNGFLRALPGDRALLPPSPARRACVFASLNASVGASGPHGFAVRVKHASSCVPPRPSHPAPNVRDDAYAPLIEAGRRGT
jgi:hypothetical protein